MIEVYVNCPFCNSQAELKPQTVPSSTQQYKCTKCGAWFLNVNYGGADTKWIINGGRGCSNGGGEK